LSSIPSEESPRAHTSPVPVNRARPSAPAAEARTIAQPAIGNRALEELYARLDNMARDQEAQRRHLETIMAAF